MSKKGAFVILALVAASFARGADTTGDHFFTIALPEPDRAEIYTIPLPFHGYRQRALLEGDAARNLAALVRSQKLSAAPVTGDLPHFGMKFYRGGKLIAEETICFATACITPKASEMHPVTPSESFDAHAPQALQLEAYLDKVLPLPK